MYSGWQAQSHELANMAKTAFVSATSTNWVADADDEEPNLLGGIGSALGSAGTFVKNDIISYNREPA